METRFENLLWLLRNEEALLNMGQLDETLVLLGEKSALWKTSRWVAVRTAVLVSWLEDSISFAALRSVLVSGSADHHVADLAQRATASENSQLHSSQSGIIVAKWSTSLSEARATVTETVVGGVLGDAWLPSGLPWALGLWWWSEWGSLSWVHILLKVDWS